MRMTSGKQVQETEKESQSTVLILIWTEIRLYRVWFERPSC